MALGRVPLESVDPGEAVAANLTSELLHLLQERQKLTAANLLGNMILILQLGQPSLGDAR